MTSPPFHITILYPSSTYSKAFSNETHPGLVHFIWYFSHFRLQLFYSRVSPPLVVNINANHPLRCICSWHHYLQNQLMLSYHSVDHTAIPLNEFIENIWLGVHCKRLGCKTIFYAQKTLNSIIPSCKLWFTTAYI